MTSDKVTSEEIDRAISFIHMYLHPLSGAAYEQRNLKHRELAIKALEYYKLKECVQVTDQREELPKDRELRVTAVDNNCDFTNGPRMTREEAKNLLRNSRPKGNNAHSLMLNEALDMAIEALKQEPKIGHWIKVDDEEPLAWDCSCCNAMVSREYDYCPICGAKMKGNKE